MTATVSVVIPCLNEASRLPTLLDTLREQTAALCEVIVVDNGSSDGSPDIVRDYQRRNAGWPLRLVTCARPGAAAALNDGIAAAAGNVIVRLDGHCLPQADYIQRSVAHIQDEDVGVVGGVWDVAPGRATRVGRAIAAALTHRLATGGAAYRNAKRLSKPRAVDTVPFGCFRKALWQQVGGYDERRTVNEDYILNYRARLAGRSVVLDPAIRSTYFARGSFRELARQYFRYGWVKAGMLKHYPGALRLRQVIPGAFVATLIILGLVSIPVPDARPLLAGLLVVYAAVLVAAALGLASRTRAWGDIPLYVATFAIVQLSWGGGACLNAATFSRWPHWTTASDV